MPQIEFPCPNCGAAVTTEASEIEAPSVVCPTCGRTATAPTDASEGAADALPGGANGTGGGRSAEEAVQALVHEYFESGRNVRPLPWRKVVVAAAVAVALAVLGVILMTVLGGTAD